MFGFVFYFLGGFFLYSSLFASVGSAVGDDPQDVQQLMIPIMLPIILSFMLLTKAINNPNSTEAVIGSIVPFTSPVIMMSRLVFGIGPGVPLWQLILSMVVLIGTTVFFIFLAGRIYRVGILLYGKKVGWKEMIKWLFMK
jgi:ABC-2 type transport system permease protein